MSQRLLLLVVLLCSVSLFAESPVKEFVWETGNTLEITPSGMYRLVFDDAVSSTTVSSIAVMANGMCEFEITTPALTNGRGAGTYPVVVKYYLKAGDEVTFEIRRNPANNTVPAMYKARVVSYTWNKIRLVKISETPY